MPQLTPHLDVALLVFWAFVLFFVGLIIYLRREDRREGYPVEDDYSGRVMSHGLPLSQASQKTFHLPHGGGIVVKPDFERDPVELAARPVERFNGAPLVPTGDPMTSGVGPGSWVARRREPDLDWEGRPRIVPLSSDPEVVVSLRDPTMLGWPVLGLDGVVAGTVSELWVDRPDRLVRYLHVQLDAGGAVLAPMQMAKVDRRRRLILVDAITAAQFAGVPAPEGEGVLTAYDEERIVAYFGGGYLYATPERAEPLI